MSLIKNGNKQIFYINSYNRLNGNNSDFMIQLNTNQVIEYDKVVVLSASIPKSYYLISSTTNTFILQENATNIVITVPVGNYTKTSFRTVIQTLLNSNSTNHWVYTISENNSSIQADTGKYTFVVSGNSSQPSFIFTGTNNNCYEQLGFNSKSTNTFVSNQLISANVVNFSLESTLFIHSDICQNNTSDNVLQEIYTAGVSYNSFIKYECYNPEVYAKNFNAKSGTYRFYLSDENGNALDTNGININLTICIYKENNVFQEIENYIELRKMGQYLKMKKE